MPHPQMMTAKRAARVAEQDARAAATHPWSLRLARCGFATKGIIYLLIGLLAAQAAVGAGGKTTDDTGAIETIYQQSYGRILVGVVAVGLFAYALWLIVEAAVDLEGKGADPKGTAARLGDAALGCSYAVLGGVATQLAVRQHTSGKSSDAATQDWTARLLTLPFGVAVLVLVGLGVLGVAAFFFYQAAVASFRDELDLTGAPAAHRRWVVPLGRAGHAALGVVNVIMGIFLIIAALRHNAGEAKGVGGALAEVARRPYGGVLLAIVAFGLVAYATYVFAEARYRRLVRR